MIKYVLFDLDGTLTDPKIGITTCVKYALDYYHIPVNSLDELEPFIGPPLTDSFKEFYGFSDEQAMEAVDKYRERFSTVGLFENELYDGIDQMLMDLCEKGYELAIASSKPTVFVERILEHFHIKQYFHHIIGSFLDGRRCKKEEVVDEAIAQFGKVNPDQIIMVGDRKFDITGAHAHGLKAIGVTFGYGGREELVKAGADYIVDSVQKLQKVIMEH